MVGSWDMAAILLKRREPSRRLHPIIVTMSARRIWTMWAGVLLTLSMWMPSLVRSADEAVGGASRKIAAVLPVTGMINDVTLTSLERRVGEARSQGASVIVLEMDTPGGLVSSALQITTYIKQLDLSTLAWVRPNAYSAGAMISLACDGIVMSPRSRVGDSAPIMIGPGGGPAEIGETERAKAESPILEDFRDSANRNGYPQLLTEAMVRLLPAIYMIRHQPDGEVRYVRADELDKYGLDEAALITPANNDPPSQAPEAPTPAPQNAPPAAAAATGWSLVKLVNPADTLLTLSQDEAVEHGFARRIIADEKELAAYLSVDEVIRLPETWSEQLVNWLTSPAVRSVLMLVLVLGVYMELQSPGLGLPGALALGALVVLLGAPYLAGLAGVMDMVFIAAGMALVAVELFVLPGFGIAGILGLVMMFIGLVMTFVPNDPGPGILPTLPGSWEMLQTGVITVLASGIVGSIAILILMRYFGMLPFLRSMILTDQQPTLTTAAGSLTSTPAAAVVDADHPPVGAIGTATTRLRPVGQARFDDHLVEVMARDRWVDVGSRVRVVDTTGGQITVEPME
jgi:membrane-bound serine protease (ClpP class)